MANSDLAMDVDRGWVTPTRSRIKRSRYGSNSSLSGSSVSIPHQDNVDFYQSQNPPISTANSYAMLNDDNETSNRKIYEEISYTPSIWKNNPKDKLSAGSQKKPETNDTKRKSKFRRFDNDIEPSVSGVEQQPSNEENLPTYVRSVYISAIDQNVYLTSKLSPFAIRKVVDGICGEVTSIKPCKSGSFLIQTKTIYQVEALMKSKQIPTNNNTLISIKVIIAKDIDVSQGLVYIPGLLECSEENIVHELYTQNVIRCKRFTKGKEKIPTNLYMFTFGGLVRPNAIVCGYQRFEVKDYIPNPLRCFKCQKFGHGAKSCKGNTKCNKCSQNHETNDCNIEILKCVNCEGEHMASSRDCKVYKKEYEIIAIKTKMGITYGEARQKYLLSAPPQGISYKDKLVQRDETQNIPNNALTQNVNSEIKETLNTIKEMLTIQVKLLEKLAVPTQVEHEPVPKRNIEKQKGLESNQVWDLVSEIQKILSKNYAPQIISQRIATYVNKSNLVNDYLNSKDGISKLTGKSK